MGGPKGALRAVYAMWGGRREKLRNLNRSQSTGGLRNKVEGKWQVP